MIRIEDVVFRYYENAKRNILDHAALTVREGGVTVLMGSSGCGKSTLAAVSCGLLPENGGYLEQGEVTICGKLLSELTPDTRARYVTMMFQNPDLQFCMDTLRKEMQFCMENICVLPEEMDVRIAHAAQDLGMSDLLDRKLHTLSGGEKQKAALCCLYVMESRCIILDEPFANIDPVSSGEIIQLLMMLKKKRKQTILVIDHRLEQWLPIADEIILMGEGGKVLARDLNRDNLDTARELFATEGIAYPGDCPRRITARSGGAPVVSLQKVKVPVPEKKRWRRQKEKTFLLEDVELSIPAGTMTAILGNSGCGKTSLFLSMLQQHSYGGKILFDGREKKAKELYSYMGIVFQNPANQFITQNVRQEVEQSIRRWEPGISEKECTDRCDILLREYGLERYHRYSPYMLSQGQQRRLAVLAVLAGHQKVLLLDEPTYGQDARSTKVIMEQLSRKVERENLTVLFTTHDENLVYAWADKAYRIVDKKLREEKLCD